MVHSFYFVLPLSNPNPRCPQFHLNILANLGAKSIAADCSSNIRDKVVLITGVSLGSLGVEFAVIISKHAPDLIILANRDGKISPTVNQYKEKIDVLVKNAGIMARPYKQTPDGVENQLDTNHNGKTYDPWLAYGQAKTANMLFYILLASKMSKKGLIPVSLYSGAIPTGLVSNIGEDGFASLVAMDHNLAQGIATHVFAAFHDSITTSRQTQWRYLDDSKLVAAEKIYPWGRDPIDAESLWKLSEEIVGEKFEY
ncbi:hypothetical protein BDV06DRAFT_212396 [Aspergillus oleicola]